MILLLLAAALQPQPGNAVEAERAFAAMAQTEGAGTAFLHWSSPEAIMFAPERTIAHDLFRGRPNPPPGLMWWPGRSWVSCDGSLAVNTGPWVRGGGRSTGTFTTVWQRQPDGQWRWLLDHGRPTPRAVAASDTPPVARASCSVPGNRPRPVEPRSGRMDAAALLADAGPDLLVQEEGAMPAARPSEGLTFDLGETIAGGRSPDWTLLWRVQSITGAQPGARLFTLHMWTGRAYRLALMEVTGLTSR